MLQQEGNRAAPLEAGPLKIRREGQSVREKKAMVIRREAQEITPTFERKRTVPPQRARGQRIPRQRAMYSRDRDEVLRKKENDDRFVKRTLVNAAVCLAIILVVLVARAVDTPLTQQVVSGLKTALTFDVSVEDTLGQLQFVQENMPGLVSAFAPKNSENQNDSEGEDEDASGIAAALPVTNGRITARFVPQKNESLDIEAAEGSDVKAVADGMVSGAGQDQEGYFAVIEHGGGYKSVYRALGSVTVEEGAAVKKGEDIGTVGTVGGKSMLRLTIFKEDVAVDPLELLGN
ncbi:MAG: peptidoglycan DD-metalloendopeptidase family protein [Christensenellales bacterium]|jgi:murein DD-endopeptidase MepM/ murein hydrolase activator NlpD